MTDQETPDRTPRRKRKNESLLPILIIFVALVIAVAGAGILFFKGEPEKAPPVPKEQESALSTPAATSGPKTQLPVAGDQLSKPPPEKFQEPEQPPGPPAVTEPDTPAKRCEAVANALNGFFQHLDDQDYMNSFHLQESSQKYFTALAYRLLDNPPVVSRESDDLYTILKNMAHFFRVIGKDNIVLIKTIMDRERDKIEDVAAELYYWSASGNCSKLPQFTFEPTLAQMYEYAGFFLNTMGGRSYLFRRDSRSRLLVNYYSILLIDQANEKGINRYGIDISQTIPLLIQEIESSNQLIYKESYLDKLYSLREKYQ